MPYPRPTLTQLVNQGLQDVNSAQITDSNGNTLSGILPKAILRVLTYMLGGYAYGQYGYLDWIAQQSNPFTATDEFLYAWGALKGVYPKDSTAATCANVTFAGLNGAPIPAGTVVVRGDGVQYTTNAYAEVSAGIATVAITASTTGATANAASGTFLTIASAVPGIQASSGVANVAITGGSEQETQDAFRTRMLQVYAAPPQGGDAEDYVEWAEAVPGVTRAWCNPNGAGAGTVVVYTMFDNAEAAYGGFPQGSNGVATGEDRATAATGDQLAVANSIFVPQPVTALVYSYAPARTPINFAIADVGSLSGTLQTSVNAAIDGVFLRNGDPLNGSILPSLFESAIAAIPGMPDFDMTAPATAVQVGVGNLAVRGTVTYS